MRAIAIMNQKGGVGKTTLTVHLAFYLAELGQRALVVDADPQGNTSAYLKGKECGLLTADILSGRDQSPDSAGLSELPFPHLVACDKRLTDVLDRRPAAEFIPDFVANLQALATSYDYALIDTSPTAGWLHVAAIAATTAPGIEGGIVAPMTLQEFSLTGALELQGLLPNVAAMIRAKPNFLGFVPMMVNGRSLQEKNNFALAARHLHNIVPAKISLRDNLYIQALRAREPVWRMPGDAAKAAKVEFSAVAEILLQRLSATEKAQDVA